ncbi:diguanylate cyclase [Pseudonocardia sp. CA-107938]|uniref:GGDEF domain-containing protein n=1 Tax=Pseudonocardia sp. CA-107938 TaxID=3240021 RepID=UPI003D8D83C5
MIDLRGWKLWQLTTRSLVYVLVVDAIAVTLVVTGLDRPIVASHWAWFAALLAGLVAHGELVRGDERRRRVGAPETVHITTDTVWVVAGMLLVPWPLVAGLIVAAAVHLRLRVDRRTPHFRFVLSAAAHLIATYVAIEILALGDAGSAGLPTTTSAILAVLAALVARDLINCGLVAVAVLLTSTTPPDLRVVCGTVSGHALEISASAVGAQLAVLATLQPPLVPLVLLQLIVLDHAAQLPSARHQARVDGKTGLLTPAYWDELAHRELARALRHQQPVGLLMLDIDHFTRVNNQHGHLAGDIALRAVATTIARHLDTGSIAGRFGGEEFAILLCDTTVDALAAAAETLRVRIAELALPTARTDPEIDTATAAPLTVTVSIGGSHTDHLALSDPQGVLADLLLTADSALLHAKAGGRNRYDLAEHTRGRSDRPADRDGR